MLIQGRGRLRVVAVVLASLVLAALAVPTAPRAEPARSVADYASATVAGGVPGVSVVVTRAGRVVERAAAGGLTDESLVPVASLTKSFTAAAVLRLGEQRRLDLDEPVRRYLPWFTLDDPRAGNITIRQVLNQSSGLTDAALGFNQYGVEPATPRAAVELLRRSHLSYDPGTSWDYCNVNYWIAEALVEEVSGSRLPAYLRREVLDPLGMTSTVLVDLTGQRPTSGSDPAPTHSYAFGRAVPVPVPRTFAGGAGGLWTTPGDLATWAMFQQGNVPGGDTVLSRAARDEMHRRQSPLTQYKVGYGLGWWQGEPADGGVPRISHSGSGAGFSSYVGLFPDGVTVSVLVAAAGPRADNVATDVYEILHGAAKAPRRLSAGWVDSAAIAIALIACVVCLGGVTARHRRTGTHPWRQHAAAASCGAAALAIAAAPELAVALVGRQASWPVVFTTAPVAASAASLVALACATRAVAHLLTLARRKHTRGARVTSRHEP